MAFPRGAAKRHSLAAFVFTWGLEVESNRRDAILLFSCGLGERCAGDERCGLAAAAPRLRSHNAACVGRKADLQAKLLTVLGLNEAAGMAAVELRPAPAAPKKCLMLLPSVQPSTCSVRIGMSPLTSSTIPGTSAPSALTSAFLRSKRQALPSRWEGQH